jgi:hypothetical protein
MQKSPSHVDSGAASSESLDLWAWAERVSMVGLFTLAVGYTLFVVQDLFVPVVTAWVMGAILRPVADWAERFGVPKGVAVIRYGDGCAPDTARNHRTAVYAPCVLDRSHQRTRAADKGEVATPKSALGDL